MSFCSHARREGCTHAAVDPNISRLRALVRSSTTPAKRHVKSTIMPTRRPMLLLRIKSKHTIAPMSSMALSNTDTTAPARWMGFRGSNRGHSPLGGAHVSPMGSVNVTSPHCTVANEGRQLTLKRNPKYFFKKEIQPIRIHRRESHEISFVLEQVLVPIPQHRDCS